jgi:hypothetical protein
LKSRCVAMPGNIAGNSRLSLYYAVLNSSRPLRDLGQGWVADPATTLCRRARGKARECHPRALCKCRAR